MNFSNLFKRQNRAEERSSDDSVFGLALNYNGWSSYKTTQSMTLAAVYRCVNVITNSVASLPVKLYLLDDKGFKSEMHNDLSYLLSKRPNNKMNAYTFYGLLVKDMLMNGNAYALIIRDGKGNVTALQYVQAGLVSPVDMIDRIEYHVTGVKGIVRQEDILHFMNYSENGVFGISVLTHARRTLGIADYGDKSAENFYKSGGCKSGFLKFTGPSNNKQKDEILSAWNQSTGGVNTGPNGVAVLPSNVDFTPLSISPADAQLLESRKFQVIDICRFFGVSPTMCFDMEGASYNSVEATELAFLTDTLRPLLAKIELEMETKLFKGDEKYDIKFDERQMLRTDKTSQASYFNSLFQMGVLTTNDIRKEIDLPPVEGGDESLVQVNLCKLKNIGNYNNADQDNRLQGENINNNNEDKQ